MLILPAASLLAESPSEIEILRARVDVQDRRISQLEKTLTRLSGSSATADRASVRSKNTPQTSPKTTTQATATSTRQYTVVKGDTLTRIAYRHQTTVSAIKKENGLKNDGIHIGQKLRIATAADTPKVTQKRQAQAPIAQQPSQSSQPTQLSQPTQYKVKAGDTFYGIARQYQMTEAALQEANPQAQPTRLQVGQTLVIDGRVPALPKTAKVAKKAAVSQEVATAPVKKTPIEKPAKKVQEHRIITVHQQMTFGEFASKHGASTTQLNSLNGLDLGRNIMLAKGSELYVPQY